MNNTMDKHLNDDQILMAIVDANDLPVMAQKHLAGCPQCRRDIEQVDEELSTLGRLARRFSPSPGNRITLPVEKKSTSFLGGWKWQISFGAAFSVLLVFSVIWWTGITNTFKNEKTVNLSEEMFEDEKLMTEISSLSENALPPLYMNITGEPDPETEDDFIDFIDPSNEDISLS